MLLPALARKITAAALLLALVAAPRAAESPAPASGDAPTTETAAQRDARMAWWRDARFGLFIHWGIYAVPAGSYQGKRIDGIGEWIQNFAMIPIPEYSQYATQFTAEKFDADAWVRMAKDAGMKYVVITSKHHDGFAMYPSKVSDYNLTARSPFKRDPLQELAAACARHGLKFGFYYSQSQDWFHPGGAVIQPVPREITKWDPQQEGDYDKYIDEIAIPQVRELLTNYGDIAIFWWDTPHDLTPERVRRLAEPLALQPHIITNDRLGTHAPGDVTTPEQHIPANGIPGRDWETCMTMNDTWGFKSYDDNWKPTETLLRNLIDIVSKGGNYLLNVGPKSDGEIPAASIERLQEVGAWMRVNGESIYGSGPAPFDKAPGWGRVTRKGNTLYLHVFDWPASGALTLPLLSPVKSARLLAAPQAELTCLTDAAGLTILLPAKAPDPIASVIAVEMEGEPQVADVTAIRPAADGSLVLAAVDSKVLESKGLFVETLGGVENLGRWLDPTEAATWSVAGLPAGEYEVTLNYALDADSPRQFALEIGAARLEGEVTPTGAFTAFQPLTVGTITLPALATATPRIQSTMPPGHVLMNLRTVTLKPLP